MMSLLERLRYREAPQNDSRPASLKKIPKKFATYCILATMITLFIINNLVGVSVNRFTYVAVFFVALIVLSMDDIYIVYACVVPMGNCIPLAYINLMLLIYLFVQKRLEKTMIILLLLIAIQELTLSAWYSKLDLPDEIWFFSALGMFWSVLSFRVEGDMGRLLTWFVIGTTVMLITLLIMSINQYGIEAIQQGRLRLGSLQDTVNTFEVATLSLNANEVGFFAICASSISLLLILCGYSKSATLIASAIITTAIGVLSLSRTFMICLAAMVILILLSRSSGMGDFLRKAVLIAFSVILACAAISMFPPIVSSMENRFMMDSTLSAGSRTILFNEYNEYLLDNPVRMLFGLGVFGGREITGIFNNVHNGIQQTYVSLGIIGALPFWVYTCYLVAKLKSGVRVEIIYFTPFLCTLLFIQSIQLFNPYIYLAPLSLSALCIRLGVEMHGNSTAKTI